jgi:hypothetical protein
MKNFAPEARSPKKTSKLKPCVAPIPIRIRTIPSKIMKLKNLMPSFYRKEKNGEGVDLGV